MSGIPDYPGTRVIQMVLGYHTLVPNAYDCFQISLFYCYEFLMGMPVLPAGAAPVWINNKSVKYLFKFEFLFGIYYRPMNLILHIGRCAFFNM